MGPHLLEWLRIEYLIAEAVGSYHVIIVSIKKKEIKVDADGTTKFAERNQ